RRRICAASGSGLSPPSAAIGSPGMKNTRKYTRNVAPKKTGIICSTRRSTYQVILALPMGRRGGGEDGRGPIRPRRVAGGDRGRRCCASPVPPPAAQDSLLIWCQTGWEFQLKTTSSTVSAYPA